MKILYVEDNPANLFLIRRVAKMGQHEVMNYIDGEEVLRKIDIVKPDLILMDIQLAGDMTGLDVVRELRKQGYTLPIIAVTAYAMVGDRERCLEAGCDDYVAKPLPINRMVEIFEKYQQDVTEAEKRRTATQETPFVAPNTAGDLPQKPDIFEDTQPLLSADILSMAAAILKNDTPPTMNQQSDLTPPAVPTQSLTDDNTAQPPPAADSRSETLLPELNKGSQDNKEIKPAEKKRTTGETLQVIVEPATNNND